ncbi:hypothetical protein [Luteipulveratus halotolerans]|uniref:Uncharacterized protein n=1 Tax=Luteipulveratus halotolerans TaxID=1631356 RepID=A0A0L6CGX6_9MICO|nr:hypothetical protein [Luteipulveratus halotolerans]KNX36860.1 hypothetical protein VV01_06380 [Luteipulveratus halotolerans]
MTTHERPERWAAESLARPDRATALLDDLLTDADRERGSITLLLCDRDGLLLEPLALSLGDDDRSAEADSMLARLTGVFEAARASSLVMAVVRPGYSAVTDADRRWHQAVIDLTSSGPVRLLGTYVVTRSDVVRLPDPLPCSA